MASARSFPELSFAGFAGEVTDYVSGPTGTLARITNDVVTYLHPDHLGSAQAGTRANGTVAWREQYTPFGEQLQNPAANDNLDGFTGHIKDSDTGLNPCIFPSENCTVQARYYDPVIGRFLSVDPVGFLSTGNPAMFNRYGYAFNDPINLFDPDGMKPITQRCKSASCQEKMLRDVGMTDSDIESFHEMRSIPSKMLLGGGAMLTPADEVGAAAVGAKIGLVGRFGWQARALRSLDKTAPGLNRAHTKSINKIKNIIGNNLKPNDFKGVKAELKGIDTGFDHVTEMRQSLTGLTKSSDSLAGSLKNPNLTKAQRGVLSNAKKRADQAIKRMNKALDN